jgi:serine/threonine protein kinase
MSKKIRKKIQKKIQKKGKGGKFIAEGSSGCVVSPNYKCTSEDEVSHNKISKIFGSKTSFEAEIKESDIFKTIDPTGKYFFKIYNQCVFDSDLNKEQGVRENDLDRCPIKDGKRYMYIGDNAGLDLTNIKFMTKEQFDKMLITILKGLVLLKKNNLVHRDIKPANLSILSDGRGMILDYGLVTNVSMDKLNSSHWHSYGNLLMNGTPNFIPHENYFILGFIMNKDEQTIKPFYNPRGQFTEQLTNKYFKNLQIGAVTEILSKMYNLNKFQPFFLDGIEKKNSGYGSYIFETLTKKYNKLIQDSSIDRKQYLKNYVNNSHKNDVYGLGLSLLEIIKQNRLKIANFDDVLYNMIDKMIEPDIDKRWDAEQILNHDYFKNIHINKLMNNAKDFSKKLAIKSLNQYIQNTEDFSKKIRKHQGITQTGGNKGKLKKGYRYSGKKLKSGLPQIIKSKKR